MAKRKIKVVRCSKCSKRYGSMKEGQKCPHCARHRKNVRGPLTSHAKQVRQQWADRLRQQRADAKHQKWVNEQEKKALGRKRNISLVTADAAIDLLSRTRKKRRAAAPKRRSNRIPSRLKGRKLTTLEMVRMLPKKEVARIRRSVERRKNVSKRTIRSRKYEAAIKRRKAHVTRARRHGVLPSGGSSLGGGYRITGPSRLPNPTAQHMWKKFHGMPSRGDVAVRASKQFPSKGTWVIGPVNYLKVRQGAKRQTVRFGKNARLIANGKRLFGIANARFKQHRGVNPEVHRIVVDEVGYEKVAPHLNDGYTGLTPWKHKFGEESGRKSLLYIDHEGYAILGGGGAHAKADGIHD